MKNKFIAAGLAGLMSVSTVFTAFAAPEGLEAKPSTNVSDGGIGNYDNGTDIYAGVILDDPDAKIRVNVPTLFAFVVNGAINATDADDAITVQNDGLLLPNVKVSVDDPTTNNGSYQVQVVSDGAMYFENFSTVKDESNDVTGRKGAEVTIKGSIENQGDAINRNYWEHVGEDDKLTTGETSFKKYRLSVDGKKFSTPVGKDTGIWEMGDVVTLAAPDVADGNVDKNTNFAINGSKKDVVFDVEVGGTRGMYRQVEESAKVGTIVWTVGYKVDNTEYSTAPSNAPQETPDDLNPIV